MKHHTTLLLLLASATTNAQNAYSFERTQQPYAELMDATFCDFNSDGDDPLPELNGETFVLYGQAWTGTSSYPITIGGHGFLRIENASALVILDGFFTNIEAVDSMSNVSYAITGEPGARVLTAQWHNIRLVNGPDDSYLNYQIRLYQATGVVEVHMGPNSGSAMDFTDASGPNCGVFHSPQNFSGCYGKLWVEQDANSPTLDSLPNYDFDALHNLPAPNTLYRFTPRFVVNAVPDRSPFSTLNAVYDGQRQEVLVSTTSEGSGGTFMLLGADGRIVFVRPASPGLMRFAVIDLPPGMYTLVHDSRNGAARWRFVR